MEVAEPAGGLEEWVKQGEEEDPTHLSGVKASESGIPEGADGEEERMNFASPNGGLKCPQKDVDLQRKAVRGFLKQLGWNVLEGKDVINTSLPVALFEPRSYLHRLVDAYRHLDLLFVRRPMGKIKNKPIQMAARAKDPLERLQYVIAHQIAGLHLRCLPVAKPFNPILGETLQCRFEEHGVDVYCEQVSHHPPIAAWEFVGPDGLFKLTGHGAWEASLSGTSIKGVQRGINTVEFQDGGVVKFQSPPMYLRGIFWGEMLMNFEGKSIFEDKANGLACAVEYAYGVGFIAWFTGNALGDYFRGDVYRRRPDPEYPGYFVEEVVSKLSGSWLGHVEFDEKTLWDYRKQKPTPLPTMEKTPMLSDCRFREDLIALAKYDGPLAVSEKHRLEELQRTDRKMRKEGAKERK